MSLIRQLPPSVINKIAAGEVIERPASVVKELLENSIDAGASRIDVSVVQGGMDLVRVVDNGSGIAAEELPLAVASHATSKIREADDLFCVRTLGFRGEALASIAEVSHLVIRSRTPDSAAGAELEVAGGRAGSVTPCAAPVGTLVEVRNLFFNTPVRRKFLRSTQTEAGHVSEAVARLALAHPQVHFTLRHNDRLVHDLPPVDNWKDRIASLFGAEIASGLIPVHGGAPAASPLTAIDDVRLSGYVADPSQSRSHNRMQYFFLNGRHIRDRALQHALSEAYRGLLLTGRYPIAFVRMEVRPEAVDVNVHPTKLEVRFQDGGRVYSQLLGALRKKFLASDLTARPQLNGAAGADSPAGVDSQAAEAHRRELVAWAKGQLEPSSAPDTQAPDEPSAPRQADLDLQFDRSRSGLSLTRLDRAWPAAGARPATPTERPAAANGEDPHPAGEAPAANGARRALAMQIHNRYIIAESDEGMVVIDQHALHERILYEQIREKALSGQMESQRLLAPEPVHLTAAEAAAALEARPLLAKLGIEIEPFGGDTVLVQSYPAMLANMNPGEVLRQALERLMSGGKSVEARDLLDELLHMLSCKAAIKAGDRLSPEEMTALLEKRDLCRDAHHCPHGRPTALVFTREELDRRFKRT
jgi:DNA mismatch repair protein MutL